MEKLIVANWKEHKTIREAMIFLEALHPLLSTLNLEDKKVVICPSFPALAEVAKYVLSHNLPISIGAQNISAFEEGAFTGEVSARQVKELAQYVIIGHSERRRYFHESAQDIAKKAVLAQEAGLIPIVCVQDEQDIVPDGIVYIAFEPVGAIGTGNPEDPHRVEQVFTSLSSKYAKSRLIYGGSINEQDVRKYATIPLTSGFLVGGASLDPQSFIHIIKSC